MSMIEQKFAGFRTAEPWRDVTFNADTNWSDQLLGRTERKRKVQVRRNVKGSAAWRTPSWYGPANRNE